jgi:U4/U6 small nuclear ribonucleoprotein SNU13
MPADTVAWPIADETLSQQLLDLVQQASHCKQVRKGANEVTKTINRGIAELIVLACDTSPLAVILPLPRLCEDESVPYVYIRSQHALGRACGISRPVVAASITTNEASTLAGQFKRVKDAVERLAVRT